MKEELIDPKKLILLAKQGDEQAFESLYKLYLTPVYRYILLRIQNKELAEDLTQTVFVKVFQSLGKFQDLQKSPLAYFFTIARNTVIDYARKTKPQAADPESELQKFADSSPSPEQQLKKNDDLISLYSNIGSLTEEQQEVIILKFVNDRSNREIAQILNKTEQAIRQLQSRAIKTLKDLMKKEYE